MLDFYCKKSLLIVFQLQLKKCFVYMQTDRSANVLLYILVYIPTDRQT